MSKNARMDNITVADPEAQSADLVAENIAQLRKLFPELITEGARGVAAVNVDVLKALVGDATISDADEKYGLNWHGKRRARQLALTPSAGTLRPCPEDSVEWDSTQNLMIEGDNLEVLKLLQKSYAGKIKLIYIDPPYNTGKDFVYPDNFQDSIRNYKEITGQTLSGRPLTSNTESSGRFHTEWLNMMYPRLKLAHALLKRDGVMLLSIDEHEIAHLRAVMDEIFGEENFLSCLTWEKGRKNDAKFFSNGHEYVLVYAKSQGYLRDLKTLWREEKPGAREIWMEYLRLRELHGDNDAAIEQDLQAWYSSLPRAHPAKKWSRYKRVDANGPWRDRDMSWPGGGGPKYDVLHPRTGQPCVVPEAGWRYATAEEMQRQIKLGLVEFRSDHTEPPFRKAHIRPIPSELDMSSQEDDQELEGNLSDEEGEPESDEEFATQVRGSYFYKQSQVSVKYLRSLFGKKVFNNPKDVEEIARLVRYVTSDDPRAIVLDFFAGSGTTGEAVMRLNHDDRGSRRYVLVQLQEVLDPNNKEQKVAARFCAELGKPARITELTKERLRRSALVIGNDNSGPGVDLGFRVYKLDQSNIRAWHPTGNLEKDLVDSVEHIVPGRSEQDVLTELLLKLGLDLCVPIEQRQIAGKTVHAIGGGVLMACLDPRVERDEAEGLGMGIAEWHVVLAPAGDTTCVFRDSAFENDEAKTNLAAILEQHGIHHVRSL